MGTPRVDRFSCILAALALLGAGLVLARQAAYGVNLHWDSINYIAMARNLLAGEGFVNYGGDFEMRWAPLYPMLLAAAGFGVFDSYDVAGPVNAAVFGLTVFVVGQYLRRRLESRFLVWWACVAVVLSLPVTNLASWALAEAPFILLATLALIQTDKFLSDGRNSSLVWAAAFCALAWLTRYIGVVVPIAVGLLLLSQRGVSLREKAKSIAVFSPIVASPMCLWWLRNYLRTGEYVGVAETLDLSLGEILGDALSEIGRWAAFGLVPSEGTTITIGSLAVLVLIAGACISTTRSHWKNGSGWRPLHVFSGFALVYLVLFVVAAMSGHTIHGFQPRYAVPMYVPLVVAAAVIIDRFLSRERKRKPSGERRRAAHDQSMARGGVETPGLLGIVLMGALSLWAAGQVRLQVLEIGRANTAGIGSYNQRMWAESETLRYLRQNPLAGRVYSNVAILVYHHNAGAATYGYLPQSRPIGRIVRKGGSDTGPDLSRWIANVTDGAHVVWLQNYWSNDLYGYDDATIGRIAGLEPVAELADGTIFRVNKMTAEFENAPAEHDG